LVGIATLTLREHDGWTEGEAFYPKLFSLHFSVTWRSSALGFGKPVHIAWQGNFEQWVADPLPIPFHRHAILVSHFGQGAITPSPAGRQTLPVNIAYSASATMVVHDQGMTTKPALSGIIFMIDLSAWGFSPVGSPSAQVLFFPAGSRTRIPD